MGGQAAVAEVERDQEAAVGNAFVSVAYFRGYRKHCPNYVGQGHCDVPLSSVGRDR